MREGKNVADSRNERSGRVAGFLAKTCQDKKAENFGGNFRSKVQAIIMVGS
jgi:hypothetical protein